MHEIQILSLYEKAQRNFRYTDIGPTDIGPTDIGPTDIGPTDIGPTDIGPTGHWSDKT